jgi:hypothetical protein
MWMRLPPTGTTMNPNSHRTSKINAIASSISELP